MDKSKLIELMRSFSLKEFEEFSKKVDSFFPNAHNDSLRLMNYLVDEYPELEKNRISKEVVTKKIFPAGKFKNPDKSLRYAMSNLNKALEQFLIHKQLDKQVYLREDLLWKELHMRGLRKHSKLLLLKREKELEQFPYRDGVYYEMKQKLFESYFVYDSSFQSRNIKGSLQDVYDNSFILFSIKQLKYCCEIINRQNILKEAYDFSIYPHINEIINNPRLLKIPIVSIYRYIYYTLTDSDQEQHYFDLMHQVNQNIDKFSHLEQKDIIAFAQNYCIKMINQAKHEFLDELFKIYLLGLEKGLIYNDDYLEHSDFKNIVTVSLRLKKFEWTEQFINNYKGKLRSDLKQNSVNYNQAQLSYWKKEYKDSLKKLLQIEFTDVYYHLDSKALILKNYYELYDIEMVLNSISTFRTYLSRNRKISDYQKNAYLNFLKVLKKIVYVRLGDEAKIDKIKEDISKMNQLADSTWLKSKLEELS